MEPASRPVSEGSRAARGAALWLLGVAVVATTLGMTAATFRGDGTAINAFLFLTGEMSHVDAARLERTAMGIVLVLSIAALSRPHWALLLPVGGYALAEALARTHERGYAFSEWALTAQAPRYLTPLAVIFLLHGFRRSERAARWGRLAGAGILKFSLALVFAVHGLEALRAHPEFVDLIISTTSRLPGMRVSERTATQALQVIGVVDLVVATAILARPHPAVLWWAAFWGTATALSRMTAYGFGAYPEVLVRTAHVLAPLALLLLARTANPAKLPRPAGPDADSGAVTMRPRAARP
jgi:hypothetical protein